VRNGLRAEELPERRVVPPPTELNQVQQRFGLVALLGCRAAGEPAAQKACVQNEMADALRMAHCITHTRRAAAGHADEREFRQPARVHDRVEILDMTFAGEVIDFAIRQPTAARIEANERMGLGQCSQPRTPDGRLPVQLQMGSPLHRSYERRPRTADGIGDARVVATATEADLLCRQ